MAYNTRSLQGVKQVTPESSRLLRESERFTGAAKAKIQGAAATAAMYEAGTGTRNPLTKGAEESAKSAIIAAQQMALQGDFNPDNVVSPMRQDFFGAASSLPLHQQTALYNRYAPEMRKQNLLYQQEQKSYLQLKEAQRKARFAQAGDALQAPVSQRLEEIMGSGANAKTQFSEIQKSLFANPQALGNPITSSLYETAFNNVGAKLDKKEKKKGRDAAMRANLISQAVASGNPAVITSLMKGKRGKGVLENAAKLAGVTAQAKETIKSNKRWEDEISTLKGANRDTFNALAPRLRPRTTLQQLELDVLTSVHASKQAGEEVSKTVAALDRFIIMAKGAQSSLDEYSTNDDEETDKIEAIVQLLKTVVLKDEDLEKLLGKDITKLDDISSLGELLTILHAAAAQTDLQGNRPDMAAEKTAEINSLLNAT